MIDSKNLADNVQSNPAPFPLIYEKKLSKKGYAYDCISVDLGYRKVPLTFSRDVIAEVLGVSFSELNAYPLDTVKRVGDVRYAK